MKLLHRFFILLVYIFTWLISWPVFKIYLKLTKTGRENIPKGGAILACNHRSNLDPVLLSASAGRPVAYMAKAELFKVFGLAALIRCYAAFPVDRTKGDTQALDTAMDMMKEGYLMGMFPEGTRHNEEHIGSLKSGVAMVAAKSGMPVVPAALANTDKAMGKGSKGIKSAHVKVTFGKPIYYNEINPDGKVTKDNIKRFNHELSVAIQELYDIIK